jgi:hypothetical protein
MKKIYKLILVGSIFLGLTATAYSEDTGVDIHGFVSQGYLKTSDNNYLAMTKDGTFEFNEIGINFGTELTDNLRIGMQLFSKDLGPYGNNAVVIDWAYGDYRWRDWLGVRVGKLKAPHGLYNETRDVDMLRNWIFLPQSIYPDVARDATLNLIGGGIYGNIDMDWFGGLSYQAMVGTQNIEANEHLAQTLKGVTWGGTEVQNRSIDVEDKYILGLTWDTPLDGLRLGGTYQRMDLSMVSDFDFTNHPVISHYGAGTWYDDLTSETFVASAEYTWNNLLLVAEYMWAERELDYASQAGPVHEVHKPDGWYLGASYRFTDWFELGGYYSEYYPEKTDRDGDSINPNTGLPVFDPSHRAYLKDICLTTRFDITEYLVIKLEGHQMDGSNQLSGFENLIPTDGSDQFKDDWQMFAAKVTISF